MFASEKIYPIVDINEWCNMYEIEIKENPCLKCGIIFPFTKPFASQGFRGVTQEIHSCGEGYIQSIYRPVGENEKQWNILMGVTK